MASSRWDLAAPGEGAWCGRQPVSVPAAHVERRVAGTDGLSVPDRCAMEGCGASRRARASPYGAFPDVPLHSLYKHRPRLNVFCHLALLFPFLLGCVLT